VTLAAVGGSGYKIGLFVHILAVVLAFGPTFAYGLFFSVLPQSPRSAPALLDGVAKTNRYLVTPGTVVVLLAGVYLLSDGDWDSGEAFIAVGFVAVLALLALQLFFFIPQGRKARELAARDLESGDSLSEEFEAVGRRLGQVGGLAGLIVVVTIFFMTYKPFL
jgi:amino acid permease